ncbi:hypothetical protein Moror_5145 [Moniliophthora roreri MCA 2997]|uniref:MYND-type domain-containing protein n=2 Tax=Moniliophthora roreri TaxID=221103 RepID=V2X9X4_MONRO|nr:hypothetical protein Moror_5145 [Moniliophthora roreri MCA 2997]
MDGLNSNNFDHTSFIREAKIRYPTARQAVGGLRRLGRPPQKLDSSQYGDKIEAALDALGVLGDDIPPRPTQIPPGFRESVEFIKANWIQCIGPWVQKFLQLAEEESFSPPYPLIVDKVLFVIPKLASYPYQCTGGSSEAESVELLKMAPYLCFSATKVWLKTLGAMHWTWMSWAELMTGLFVVNNPNRMSVVLADTLGQYPEESKEVAGSAIQLFNLLSGRLSSRQITPRDFIGVHMALGFMMICFSDGDQSPLYTPFLASWGVKALVKLLDSLVSKRAIVFASTGTKVNDDLAVLDALLTLLEATSNSVLGWMDALDAGLLITMFNTGKLYPPASPEDQSATLGRLWHHYNGILQFLSLYMVYPDVLRCFLKAMRRVISDEGLEERMKHNRSFWRTWKECKRKAKMLRIMKDSLKDPVKLGSTVCSYLFCPLKDDDSPRETPEGFSRFLRCTGCHSAIYCSRTCQRKHWKASHKGRCNELAQALKGNLTLHYHCTHIDLFIPPIQEGRPYISDRDRAFFVHLITFYIWEHDRDILEELSEFTPPTPWDHPAGNGDDNEFEIELKRNGHNTGLVVLDFCNIDELDIRSLDCLSVRHIDDVVKDRRIRGRRIAKRLKEDHMWIVGDTEMHVLAFFPDTTGGGDIVYPVSEVYDLPQLSEPDSGDDEGWITDDSFEGDSEDD